MIYVNRKRNDVNGKVIKPATQWFNSSKTKTNEMITQGKYLKKNDGSYKTGSVKRALEKLFYDKCAYCETKIIAASSWDVEHYRPKGRVQKLNDAGEYEILEDHSGYYWLSLTWENLYASCQLCNQNRKDTERYEEDDLGEETGGKIDKFPLVDESKRAFSVIDDLTLEDSLLLDPCSENYDPEDYFAFQPNGQILAVDTSTKHASETINTCHLNRRRLKVSRKRRMNEFLGLFRVYKRLKTDGLTELANTMMKEFEENYLDDSSEYAAVMRHILKIPEAYGIEA